MEAGDVVEDGFHAGGDGDGEDESGAAPEEAPEHESDGDGEGVEMDPAADHFGVEQV